MATGNRKIVPVLKRMANRNQGVAAIEVAILLPILLVIVFAVIEFGNYYMMSYTVSKAESRINTYLTTIPNPKNSSCGDAGKFYCQGELNREIMDVVNNVGLGVATFDIRNHICAQSFPAYNYNAARIFAQNSAAAKACDSYSDHITDTRVDLPWATDSAPYYIGYAITVPYATVTGLSSFAGFDMPTDIVASGVVTVPPTDSPAPTTACGPFQYVTWNGSAYTCADNVAIPQNCFGSTKYAGKNTRAALWNGSSFQCVELDFMPDVVSCELAGVNGLVYSGGTYSCARLPEPPDSTCTGNTDYGSYGYQGTYVKYNASTKTYSCSGLPVCSGGKILKYHSEWSNYYSCDWDRDSDTDTNDIVTCDKPGKYIFVSGDQDTGDDITIKCGSDGKVKSISMGSSAK